MGKRKTRNKLTKTNTTTCFRTTYISAASVSVIVVGRLLFKTAPKTSFLPKFSSSRFLFFSFFNFISFLSLLHFKHYHGQYKIYCFCCSIVYHNKYLLCKNIFIYFGQFLFNVNIKHCFYFTQWNIIRTLKSPTGILRLFHAKNSKKLTWTIGLPPVLPVCLFLTKTNYIILATLVFKKIRLFIKQKQIFVLIHTFFFVYRFV